MRRPSLRLVLDTNVWLDWLVFRDPSAAYDLGRHSIDAAAQAACLAECRRIARPLQNGKSGSDPDSLGWGLTPIFLPRCADPGDQIFLEAALAARADFLVTKDRALLDLGRRGRAMPFRIVTPDAAA